VCEYQIVVRFEGPDLVVPVELTGDPSAIGTARDERADFGDRLRRASSPNIAA
jgi:hypothetical protein